MRRRKTATASNVMLLDIPKMIIDKYAGLAKDGKVFPVPSNALRNPLESLGKMLGHKNIATTQIYAKILNEKVGKDMQKVSHKFKSMEQSFVSQP